MYLFQRVMMIIIEAIHFEIIIANIIDTIKIPKQK